MHREKWSAFTLLESLLVLFIAVFLALFPMIKSQRWEETIDRQSFFDEMERIISLTQESAIFSNNRTRISMEPHGESVIFEYYLSDGKLMHKELKIPKTVVARSQTRLTFLGTTGNLSKVTFLQFNLPLAHQKITYQFYLGSGKYVKKLEGE